MRRGARRLLDPRRRPQHPVPGGADGASALCRRAVSRPTSSPRNFPTASTAARPQRGAAPTAVSPWPQSSITACALRDGQISGPAAARHAASAAPSMWLCSARITRPVTVAETAGGHAVIGASGSVELVSDWQPGEPLYRGAGRRPADRRAGRARSASAIGSAMAARPWIVLVLTPRAAELAGLMPAKQPPDLSRFLLSPMPGLLVSLAVTIGRGGQGRPGAGRGRGDEDGERAARRARRQGRQAACGSPATASPSTR